MLILRIQEIRYPIVKNFTIGAQISMTKNYFSADLTSIWTKRMFSHNITKFYEILNIHGTFISVVVGQETYNWWSILTFWYFYCHTNVKIKWTSITPSSKDTATHRLQDPNWRQLLFCKAKSNFAVMWTFLDPCCGVTHTKQTIKNSSDGQLAAHK